MENKKNAPQCPIFEGISEQRFNAFYAIEQCVPVHVQLLGCFGHVATVVEVYPLQQLDRDLVQLFVRSPLPVQEIRANR